MQKCIAGVDAHESFLTYLPIFPNSHSAGHSPGILGAPGSCAENSMMPPVKQNLFHV
jgi:hypothetical protein